MQLHEGTRRRRYGVSCLEGRIAKRCKSSTRCGHQQEHASFHYLAVSQAKPRLSHTSSTALNLE